MDEEEKNKTEETTTPPEDTSSTPEEAQKSTPEAASLDEETEAPADALSRTPEDLGQEAAAQSASPVETTPVKKPSVFKRFFRKVYLYFLIFALLLVIAAAITIVNYINSQKANPTIDIATQELADKTLEQLANTDVTVGNTSQTLTIQGNAIIAGQTLMRGSANIAGNLQVGGSIQGPSISISGAATFGQAQAQTLQVQNTLAVQGNTTLRDLSVSGAATFNGAVTANQLTATNFTLSGNATLNIPNHISFNGPSPTRGGVNGGVLGSGGTLSISGSDTSGTINIQTGNGTSAGCFGQINFNRPFTRQPRIMVSPVGQAAGQTQFYTNRSTTSFSICTANAAPANQTFSYDYFVTY